MTTDTTTTIEQFIAANRITLTSSRTDRNPNMDGGNMDHWRVTLRCAGRKMSLVFSKGIGHNGAAPTADEVLDCLASDASGVIGGRDFGDWCSEYGYSEDSRSALRTWNAVNRQMRSLERLLGSDAFAALLWNTERM